MKIFKIKMTAARTNPQLRRSVEIDSEKNVGELLDVADIVFEYGGIKKVLSDEADNILSNDAKLEDILTVGDFLTVKYDDKNVEKTFLEVLAVVEKPESDSKPVPVLERYRTVPRRLRERNFYYSVYNQESIEDFRRYLNRQLIRGFLDITEVPEFEWTIARPWKSFLDVCTVAELKNIIKENGVGINLAQRKEQLKKELVSSSSDEFFANILKKINISEYFRLKDLCINGTDEDFDIGRSFPVLSKNFLVVRDYWDETMLASEFMRFYESWLEDGKEKEYFLKNIEGTCLTAACTLYGFADKELVAEFYHIMNPETGQKDTASDIWKKTFKCEVQDRIKLSKKDELYYDSESLSETSAMNLYHRFIASNRVHYLPTKKEITEIVAYGIAMAKQDRQLFLEIMENKYHISGSNAKFITKEIERAIRNGYPNEDVIKYLKNILTSGLRGANFDKITDILDRVQKKIRKIVLGGYTQEEFDKIIADKKVVRVERKIYPNDPCPCGSGKKYKNCCGRR